MKLHAASIAAVFGGLFSVAYAQRAEIGYPADGATIHAGSSLVVEIDRPDTLSSSAEVAVVLGLQACTPLCHSVNDGMGTVLYNGKYNPQFQPSAPFFKPPHENFTVNIPQNFPKGKAQLGLYHVSLIGAGLAPFNESRNVTVTVV